MGRDDQQIAYRDPDAPVQTRVGDLLSRMTVEEKAGQVVGTWAGQMSYFNELEEVKDAVREHTLGTVATFGWGGAVDVEPADAAETVNEIQTIATEETRLGIPVLFSVDGVHGHAYLAGATVFPNGLGLGATWDPDLVEQAARVCAQEVSASGAQQNYSPICDVARSPRSGRVIGSMGESPTLVGELAAARVRGYQGSGIEEEDSVIATAKHYPAYGKQERGEDASPAEISRYRLCNTFLPPFEAAIDAGVESVMGAYNSTEGEPIHGSKRFLSDLLRGDLGFDGHIISDWGGVRQLHEEHGVTADWCESIYRCRTAGLDVASAGTIGHVERLIDLVQTGDLPEAVLDQSVRRLLTAKFRLGLFEDPFVDVDRTIETVGHPDHRNVARKVARHSLTLLKNDDLLPLEGDEDVFVGGPSADNPVHQVGGWSVSEPEHVEGPTVLEAVKSATTGTVTHEQGSSLNEALAVQTAKEKASAADVAILVLGEGWYIHEFGPMNMAGTRTSEWPMRSDLRLADAQRELVKAVHETGTPTVGIVVAGRPLIVDWMAEYVPAILLAYYPGSEGGTAIAETLFGANEPKGRLPITIPNDEGDLPQHHDYHPHPYPIGEDEHLDSYDPLYEFGHGLGYTEFEYQDIRVVDDVFGLGQEVQIKVDLENVGDRAGSEVVQVYSSQSSPTRVRPRRELRAFDRVYLAAGEERTVELSVPAEEFGYTIPESGYTVESDTYQISAGGLTDEFAIEEESL